MLTTLFKYIRDVKTALHDSLTKVDITTINSVTTPILRLRA